MALPLVPMAAVAARYGVVAVAAWIVARKLRASAAPGRTDQRAEDAMDAVAEGLTLHHPKDSPQSNATLRLRRVIGFGAGRRYEIDAAALTRFRIRKV